MLGHLVENLEGDRDRALFQYFQSGASIADSMLQVLRWRFGDPGRAGKLLDFVSGYGRVTRFLVRAVPPERVWVADIYADGVRFQEERLGVHGIVSALRPEDFSCGERFDVILVTSLFTHLPEERFLAWLRVLLGPGGVLAFSVHSPRCCRRGSRCRRGASSSTRSARAALSTPAVALVDAGKRLELDGWAAARSGQVREAELFLDGERIGAAPVDGPREDVARFLGSERHRHSRWILSCPLPEGASRSAPALLRLVDARGAGAGSGGSRGPLRDLLHAEAVLAEERRVRAAVEAEALRARIAAMEASQFWKLRNAWFRVKRGLGLTDQP